jgi:hypothetical protein
MIAVSFTSNPAASWKEIYTIAQRDDSKPIPRPLFPVHSIPLMLSIKRATELLCIPCTTRFWRTSPKCNAVTEYGSRTNTLPFPGLTQLKRLRFLFLYSANTMKCKSYNKNRTRNWQRTKAFPYRNVLVFQQEPNIELTEDKSLSLKKWLRVSTRKNTGQTHFLKEMC